MKTRNLRLFYIHEFFFQLSNSMLVILLPVFIYRLFESISAVFLFVFAWNLIYGIFFIPVFNLSMIWRKPQYFMAAGLVLYIISLAIFGFITPENKWLIVPGVIVFGLYVAFYWFIRSWYLSVNLDYTIIGSQISYLGIILVIVNFLSPLLAGLFAFFVSFNITFFLSAAIGVISIIPIFRLNSTPHPRTYGVEKIKRILNKPALKAIRLPYFFEGFSHNFVYRAWILAFAIFLGNIKDLGILLSLSMLVSAVMIRMSGHWFDKRKRVKVLKRLTALRTFSAFMFSTVAFFPHFIYVWPIDFLNRVSINMHKTVIDSYLYAFSSKIHPIHFNLNREIHIIIGRLIANAGLFVFFLFAPEKALWGVIAVGSFMLIPWVRLLKSDHLLHE